MFGASEDDNVAEDNCPIVVWSVTHSEVVTASVKWSELGGKKSNLDNDWYIREINQGSSDHQQHCVYLIPTSAIS